MNYFCLLASFLLSISCFAQDTIPKGYKYANYFDFAAAIGENQGATAISWSHLHGIGKKKKINIGYGLRYTGFWAGSTNYITAPANLSSDEKTIDTLTLGNSSNHSINAFIHLNYKFHKKVDVGFTIDAVGFSFGGNQNGQFSSSENNGNFETSQLATPTSFNALLIGDNDRGQLNSEFYIRYWLSPKIGIRAGYSYLFSEYTTQNVLTNNNDRFRHKASMGFIAISIKPFN